MEANQLRIGNYIKDSVSNEIKQVETFYEHGVHTGFGKCFSFSECLPILINEEWLLKFKYIKLNDKYFTIQGHLIWICNDLFMCDKNGVVLKYVHQLQNLYFSLTGQELTIKS